MSPRNPWTRIAAPSTVDWCEPNFVYSAWVAEAFNTLSSLPIVALGVVAVIWSVRRPWRATPRFVVSAAVLTVVGVGSAAFHATLTRVGQALDELPMVYAGLVFTYVVLARNAGPRPAPPAAAVLARWRAGLVGFGIAFTAAYLFWPRWFVFFVVAYALVVTALVVRTAWIVFGRVLARPDSSRVDARLFALAVGSYVGGVLLLWLPEHVFLPCDHPVQSLHLHAWFHLTSALGSYAWLVWAAYDRASVAREPMPKTGVRPGWPLHLL